MSGEPRGSWAKDDGRWRKIAQALRIATDAIQSAHVGMLTAFLPGAAASAERSGEQRAHVHQMYLACRRWLAAASGAEQPPTIVCLIGSSRFFDAFMRANYQETMAGHVVLSIGFAHESKIHGQDVGCTPQQKVALDALHKRKIELADEVLVLNEGGYIGESTAAELAHAQALGKTIRWLESPEGST